MITSPNQLPGSTWTDEELHADILDAAEEMYVTLAAKYERAVEIIHRVGLCVDASKILAGNLRHRDHEVNHVHSPMWIFHNYLRMPAKAIGKRVIIDPTWQQFLDPALITPDTPRVLVGYESEFVTIAARQGVKEPQLGVYPPLT